MKWTYFGAAAAAVSVGALCLAAEEMPSYDALPIFGVTIPAGYRQ